MKKFKKTLSILCIFFILFTQMHILSDFPTHPTCITTYTGGNPGGGSDGNV